MIRYFHFLSATYFKKIGPYITTAIGIGIFATMTLLAMPGANRDGQTILGSISTFNKFFPFLFATLFSALSVNHIFKEGELDGSELIVVAKPLTRMQIILTKFLMLLTVILLYQIVCLITYFAIAATDKVATTTVKNEWIGSLAIGGFVVQIIAASVIVMISAVLGKVGTTVVSILFAAIIPILSFTITPLGRGQGFDVVPKDSQKANTLVYRQVNGKEILTEDPENMYMTISGNEAAYNDYKSKQWYDKAAYADVWYQWGRFYSMFTKSKGESSLVQNWVYEDKEIVAGNSLTVTIGGKKQVIAFGGNEFYNQQDIITEARDNIANAVKTHTPITPAYAQPETIANINGMSFGARIKHFQTLLHSNVGIQMDSDIYGAILAEQKLEADGILTPATEFKASGDTLPPTYVTEGSVHSLGFSAMLYEVGGKIKVLNHKDFIPTSGVVAGWSVIAIMLVLGSILVYYRRDFK